MGGREPVRIKDFTAVCATGLLIPGRTTTGDASPSGQVSRGGRLPWGSLYGLTVMRQPQGFTLEMRRRADGVGWRDHPIPAGARLPFSFDHSRRMLMLGVGWHASFYARGGRWCIRACEDGGDLALI